MYCNPLSGYLINICEFWTDIYNRSNYLTTNYMASSGYYGLIEHRKFEWSVISLKLYKTIQIFIGQSARNSHPAH